ncbi:urease accessory protein UreE [Enterovirga aerilata]|uniref:Urease accessory protein UreE n=1 Tax=Enterovirga aerilata TaxID=2730920 RepID=A0A849I772_9HYPH|nr:urease accessory protein UreE [Enterovirga sp. DB1703]NNM73594.1 urease accessory protein UreE [Enterovirga sp. DB1703]
MLRATSIVRRPAVKADRVADTLTLDHEARHRRRVALTASGGLSFLLDLDRAAVLDDGDAVKLEDGRLVQIRAAPERLIEIRTDNPLRLMKVAWHIGNRHVAAEITADAIYIAHDHVLMEMVRGLGASATVVERPFRPERGAYHEHGPDCGHDHGHAQGHGHDHEHGRDGHAPHAHAHDHGAHDHGAGCGCGHDHHHHGHDHAHHGHDHAHRHG